MLNSIWQDLRYAVRSLARSPGFTAVATLTLALDIGINSATFSVVNAVLLRSLPYREPQQLVAIHSSFPKIGDQRFEISIPEFLDLREHARQIDQIAVSAPISGNLTGVDKPERIEARAVTAGLLSMLGIEPLCSEEYSNRRRTVPVLLRLPSSVTASGNDASAVM